MKRVLSIFAFSVLAFNVSNAQTQQPAAGPKAISLTAEVAYTQDFPKVAEDATTGGLNALNGALKGLPEGWAFLEQGPSSYANGTYRATGGNSRVSDTYSFGTNQGNTDRALGSITGSNLSNIKIGAAFTNNTGKVITKLSITYTGEQWRNGGSGIANKLSFAYSLNATTSLNEGAWIAVPQLDFISLQTSTTATEAGINGNSPENRKTITYTISSLNIPKGATFWIRWENADVTGAIDKGDGLAIDDVKVSATGK